MIKKKERAVIIEEKLKQNKIARSKRKKEEEERRAGDMEIGVDYEAIYGQALQLFGEQAKTGVNGDIDDINLTKARTENFMSSLAGMLEISNKIELLLGNGDKFKRIDELRLLNKLRTQYEKSADFSEYMIDMCTSKLDEIKEGVEENGIDEETLLEAGQLSGLMSNAISNLKTLSEGTSKLIKAERETGGRSYGNDNSLVNVNNYNNSYTDMSDNKKKYSSKNVKPKKISMEEAIKMLEHDSDI